MHYNGKKALYGHPISLTLGFLKQTLTETDGSPIERASFAVNSLSLAS